MKLPTNAINLNVQDGQQVERQGNERGTDKDQRTRVLLQMQWDGKAITGAINPGPNARPLTKASVDPETWQVHLEARDIVIDGKLDNLGSAHRVLSGTWTEAGRKGDFKLTRN